MDDIGFFFEFNSVIMQLPVNPPKVTIVRDSGNKVAEVLKLGDIKLMGPAKLASISFSSFLPEDSWGPWIRTKGVFAPGKQYIKYFEGLQNSGKPFRFIITGIGISMLATVEKFSYYHQAGDHEDAYFDMVIDEYRPFTIKQLSNPIDPDTPSAPKEITPNPTKPMSPTQVTIGASVTLNGRVHYDSYGARPGKTFSNYLGKISNINKKGSHPYHVTTPDGSWLGWVLESAVSVS